jgi:hypothetical protein
MRPPVNKWHHALHALFDHPSVVLIGGVWKSGKTDFALYLAEKLEQLPFHNQLETESHPARESVVVTEVATNINTEGHYKLIYDLVTLRQWLYSNNNRKLYILDEASEHLPSRRSMSTKSVGFISIIPEISKAHGRLLIVGHQLMSVDKTLLDEVWCRGIFLKLGLKKAQLISHLLPVPYTFENIPPTSVKFDPYGIAPFQENPSGTLLFKDKDQQLLWEWANGKSIKDLGVHSMYLNRLLRKYVKTTQENASHISHI